MAGFQWSWDDTDGVVHSRIKQFFLVLKSIFTLRYVFGTLENEANIII